ncbi:MAG TPA: PQQ-dependent sugar dehydrogenase [Tissierellia bacterium]|nr:PQQ-dependent sugar dehydrogenase [Tissierellia bacterium]
MTKLSLMWLLVVLLVSACAGEAPATPEMPLETDATDRSLAEAETTETDRTGLPPVETRPPEADYPPAFSGQTRVGAVATETALEVRVLTDGLDSPWGMAELPDGRIIVTEKAGVVRVVKADGSVSEAIDGFPAINSAGQGGLLDIALAPDFEESRRLYFTLAELGDEGSVTAVGYGRWSEDETVIEDFQVIYRALPFYHGSAHYGSRLVFSDDGTLFVSTGDRQSFDTRMNAQTLDNGYGKILHIDAEGEPVADYFSDHEDALPEIYSYGHRNIQGMAIHPATGDLWISEMGPRGGDELNLILPGKNYGWPLVSYGIEYSGDKVLEGLTVQEGTEQPVYYWDPVLAPSGMSFYDHDLIREWQNDLFIGGLRGGHIARLVIEDRRVVAEERLLEAEGERFRDVLAGADGAIYAITDSGRLYRIGPK